MTRISITILSIFICMSGLCQSKSIASKKAAPKPPVVTVTPGVTVEYADTINLQWLRKQRQAIVQDEWKFVRYDTIIKSPTEIDFYAVFMQGNKVDSRLYKRILKKK